MNAAELLAQLEADRRGVASQAAAVPYGGLLGLAGKRRQKQAAAESEAAELAGRMDAAGNMAELQAAGVDTRSIPGLSEALQLGGQDVADALKGNPLTPLSPTLSARRDTALQMEREALANNRAKSAAERRKAEAEALLKERDVAEYYSEEQIIGRELLKEQNRRELLRYNGVAVPEPTQTTLTSPLTGNPVIADQPGSVEYTKQWDELQGAVEALRLVNRISKNIGMAGTSGTDYIGTRATAINADRAQLISKMFRARGLGAPQGPDVELVERGLPDSTSLAANIRGMVTMGAGGQRQSYLEGYQKVAEEMQQIATDILLQNPLLINELSEQDIGQFHPDSDLHKTLIKLREQ